MPREENSRFQPDSYSELPDKFMRRRGSAPAELLVNTITGHGPARRHGSWDVTNPDKDSASDLPYGLLRLIGLKSRNSNKSQQNDLKACGAGGGGVPARPINVKIPPVIPELVKTQYRIALLGTKGVGKTALVVRLVTKRYLHEYDPDLEREYQKSFCVDGRIVLLRIWDTVKTDWQNQTDVVDGIVLVYSTVDNASFEDSKAMLKTIRGDTKESCRPVPIVLLGNKSDLEQGRKVSYKEAASLARDASVDHLEVSAAANTNVDVAFQLVANRVQHYSESCPDRARTSDFMPFPMEHERDGSPLPVRTEETIGLIV